MLNRRRLTILGRIWLVLFNVVQIVMILLLVFGIGTAIVSGGGTPRNPRPDAWSLLTGFVPQHFQLWAHVDIVLALLIWTQSYVMHPSEDAAWKQDKRVK